MICTLLNRLASAEGKGVLFSNENKVYWTESLAHSVYLKS